VAFRSNIVVRLRITRGLECWWNQVRKVLREGGLGEALGRWAPDGIVGVWLGMSGLW